jgi:hypothetical protein
LLIDMTDEIHLLQLELENIRRQREQCLRKVDEAQAQVVRQRQQHALAVQTQEKLSQELLKVPAPPAELLREEMELQLAAEKYASTSILSGYFICQV